ncbi:MAG: hypothetical protein WCJ55_09605, partial [Chloroflexales bacterium]
VVEAAPEPVVEAAPEPVVAPTTDNSDLMQRLGQVGLIAYAQMARVSILRTMEGESLSEDQEHQIGVHIDGLVNNVQPFLAEVLVATGQLNAAERGQIGEIVEGVRRHVVALHDELAQATWPTGASQRQRLAPLRDELEATAQALQSGQRAEVSEPQQPTPAPEAPQARTYRDNLTTIHGIGPALQQRLDRAGICTYIQLALSSPEELRKALGDAARLANVDDWIVQARSLAGMPS